MTFTPANRPCSNVAMLAAGTSLISSAVTDDMALIVSRFFWEPYARTTTSSKSETSSFIYTFSVSVRSVNSTSCDS